VSIYRPLRGPIQVRGLRMPARGKPAQHLDFFKDVRGEAVRTTWVSGPNGWDGYFTIARQHLTPTAEAIALQLGIVLIALDYSTTEQCGVRCQQARSDDCTCSCLGQNHRSGEHGKWTQVSDPTLIASDIQRVVRELTRHGVPLRK
jgi:hypothetical protein